MAEQNEATLLAQTILEIVKALPAALQALPPIQVNVQVEMIPSSELQRFREENAAEIQGIKGSQKTISGRLEGLHRTVYELMSVMRQK